MIVPWLPDSHFIRTQFLCIDSRLIRWLRSSDLVELRMQSSQSISCILLKWELHTPVVPTLLDRTDPAEPIGPFQLHFNRTTSSYSKLRRRLVSMSLFCKVPIQLASISSIPACVDMIGGADHLVLSRFCSWAVNPRRSVVSRDGCNGGRAGRLHGQFAVLRISMQFFMHRFHVGYIQKLNFHGSCKLDS